MTTCAECLSAMSTSRVSDLEPGSSIALHCATCADCSRVAEEVRYAEHRLATALNEQRSGLDSSELTVAAMKGSERLRRLRVGRWIQAALIVAGCYVFFVFMEQRTKGDEAAITTRTVTLQCIQPEQAIALASPFLRSNGVVYSVPGIPAVIVRGKPEEFRRAVSAIEQFDVKCQLPRATTQPAPTSPAKPGKD